MLEGLDRSFVTGKLTYEGGLIISQQVAFLKLVSARISVEEAMDSVGNEAQGALIGDIKFLKARIIALSDISEEAGQSLNKETS